MRRFNHLFAAVEMWSMGKRRSEDEAVSVAKIGCTACAMECVQGQSAAIKTKEEKTWRIDASRGFVLDCEAAMLCRQEQHAPHTLSSQTQATMLLTHHCSAAIVMGDAPPPPKEVMKLGWTEGSDEQPYVR